MLRQQLRYLLCAMGFFTRIPLPAWVGYKPDDLDRAAPYFPLIGLLVGAIAVAAWWLAGQFWPPRVALLISLIVTVLTTGAFHEDGLADSLDGFGGGYQRADVLRIMHDSRIGSFGAIALILALLLKLETLATLPATWLPIALLAGHAASRWAAVSLLASLDYVRPEGKSKPLATRLGGTGLILASLFGGLPLLALPPAIALTALAGLLLTRQLLARYYQHRLGGYTGDALGMAQQIAELAFYLVLSACLST